MTRSGTILALGFATLCSSVGFADPVPGGAGKTVIVCYTTGSVSERDARPAVENMIRVLERIGGWTPGTFQGRFTADSKECERLASTANPSFVIPSSLGFYLRHRADLVPVAQPRVHGRDAEVLRILVRRGSASTLDALKGRTLGGSLLDDPEFLKNVVFRGRIDPAAFLVLKPSRAALRALRDLASGTLDAVLVNDQQFEALRGLPFAKDLEVVFTADPVPLPGVFAVNARTSEDERRRLARALAAFCSDADGRSFCELFGIDSFVPAGPATYDPVIRLWGPASR